MSSGSRLRQALGVDSLEVNTIHHHVISDPGDLEVTATAAGDVIEAVETRDGWSAAGVQWHPEKMDDHVQRGLFAALMADAREAAVVPA